MVYTSRKINLIYFKVYPILKRNEMTVQQYCDKDGKFETFYTSIRKKGITFIQTEARDR